MNNIINFVALYLILYTVVKDLKKGCGLYVICIYLCPVFIVGTSRLSFDIVAFPVWFFAYIYLKQFKIPLNGKEKDLFWYFLVYCVLTAITSIAYGGKFSYATAYAIFRFIVTSSIIINVWRDDMIPVVDKVMAVIMLVEGICSALQMANIVSVQFFYDLYYKTSMAPLEGQLRIGYFNRAYGTTGSPIILGGISALAFVFYMDVYLKNDRRVKLSIPKLIICVICGVLALSKTAIIAIPVATLLIFGLNLKKIGAKTFLKALGMIFGTIVLVLLLANWLSNQGFAIKYYLAFLTDPFSALKTRYGKDSGNLSYAIATIRNNFLIGVGNAKINNSFVGDSVYIVLLYETGIVGLISYFFPFVESLIVNLRKKNTLAVVMFIIFLMISLGNSLQVSYYVIVCVAIIFYEDDVGVTNAVDCAVEYE